MKAKNNSRMIAVFLPVLLMLIGNGCSNGDFTPSTNDFDINTFVPYTPGSWWVSNQYNYYDERIDTVEISIEVIGIEILNSMEVMHLRESYQESQEVTRFQDVYALIKGDTLYKYIQNYRWYIDYRVSNLTGAIEGDTLYYFRDEGTSYVQKRVYTLESTDETVNVKAGTFSDCYQIQIEYLNFNRNELDWHLKVRYWYAPGVGLVLVMEKDFTYTPNAEWSIRSELVEYDVK